MEEQNNQQSNQGMPQQNPPPKDASMRTMSSDVNSMGQTGGGEPKPFVPTDQGTGFSEPPKQPVENQPQQSGWPQESAVVGGVSPEEKKQGEIKADESSFEPPKIEPQENQTGEASAFNPEEGAQDQTPRPETAQIQSPSPEEAPPKGVKEITGKKKSPLIAWVVAFVLVVGIGLGSYFFIFPILFDSPPPAITDHEEAPAPVVVPEEEEEVAIPEEEEEVEEIEEEVAEAPEPVLRTMEMYSFPLNIQADLESEVSIENLEAGGLRQLVEFESTDVPIFKEVVVKYQGEFLSLAGLMDILLPNTFSDETLAEFIPEAYLFVFSNQQGTWPGVIARARNSENLQNLAQIVRNELESSDSLNYLYLTDPGEPGPWADGQVVNFSGRYLPFSIAGASLNVVWLDDYFLISTSWPGATEAGNRMGF